MGNYKILDGIVDKLKYSDSVFSSGALRFSFYRFDCAMMKQKKLIFQLIKD